MKLYAGGGAARGPRHKLAIHPSIRPSTPATSFFFFFFFSLPSRPPASAHETRPQASRPFVAGAGGLAKKAGAAWSLQVRSSGQSAGEASYAGARPAASHRTSPRAPTDSERPWWGRMPCLGSNQLLVQTDNESATELEDFFFLLHPACLSVDGTGWRGCPLVLVGGMAAGKCFGSQKAAGKTMRAQDGWQGRTNEHGELQRSCMPALPSSATEFPSICVVSLRSSSSIR